MSKGLRNCSSPYSTIMRRLDNPRKGLGTLAAMDANRRLVEATRKAIADQQPK